MAALRRLTDRVGWNGDKDGGRGVRGSGECTERAGKKKRAAGAEEEEEEEGGGARGA